MTPIHSNFNHSSGATAHRIFTQRNHHQGAAGVTTLATLLALGLLIFCGWWGFVMVPKNKAAEIRQTQAWIESLVASRSFLSFPSSKLTCDAMGGEWQIGQDYISASSVTTAPGHPSPSSVSTRRRVITPDYCSMPASDAGKACLSSDECESFCVGRMALGEIFTAQCFRYRNTGPNSIGSLMIVEKGRPLFKLSFTTITRKNSDTHEVLAAKMEIKMVDGSKLKVGEKLRATAELRDKPWFPSFGIPGT